MVIRPNPILRLSVVSGIMKQERGFFFSNHHSVRLPTMPPQKRVASSAPGEVTDDEEQIQRKGRSGEVSEEEVSS